MWLPSENFFIKSHVISSITTIFCCMSIVFFCLMPAYFPGLYKLLVDERISIVIPYLLFIALGEAVFSIWYFRFRK